MVGIAPSQNQDTETRPEANTAGFTPSKENQASVENQIFLTDLAGVESFIQSNESGRYTTDQREVLLDMITAIKVLDGQIKEAEAKKIPGFDPKVFETELKALKEKFRQYESEQKPSPDSLLNAEQTNFSAKEKELSNDPKLKTLAALVRLKGVSQQYEKNDTDVHNTNREALKKELNDEISAELNKMIDMAALKQEERESLHSAVPEAVAKITSENSTNKKLNIFQKVMVWFNVKVLHKDYKWLQGYLKKTAFKDVSDKKERDAKTKEYIESNYTEVAADEKKGQEESQKHAAKSTEPLPSAITPAPVKTLETLSGPLEPKEQIEPTRTPETPLTARQEFERIINTNKESKIKIAELTGQGPELLVKAQRDVNIFLEELVSADKSLSTQDRVSNINEQLTRSILDRNVTLDINEDGQDDLQRFYTAPLMQALDQDQELKDAVLQYRKENSLENTDISQKQIEAVLKTGKGSAEFHRVLTQINRSRSAMETLQANRASQSDLIINWVELARADAIKEINAKPGNKPDLEAIEASAEYRDLTEKKLSGRFVDHLLDEIVERQLVSYSTQELGTLKDKYHKLISAGVVTVQMMADEHGISFPILLVKDHTDKQGNLIYDSRVLLNELTGGGPEKDTRKLSPAYQFTLTGESLNRNDNKGNPKEFPLQCVGMSLQTSKGNQESLSDIQMTDILRHEMTHMLYAAKNASHQAALKEVFTESTRRSFKTGRAAELTGKLKNKGYDDELIVQAYNIYTTEDPWKQERIVNVDPRGNELAEVLREITSDIEAFHDNRAARIQQLRDAADIAPAARDKEIDDLSRRQHVLEQQRNMYHDGLGISKDELAAEAKNQDHPLRLNDLYIDNYNPGNKEHQSTLTLMRLVNRYPEKLLKKYEHTERYDELKANRAYLADYFCTNPDSPLEQISTRAIIKKLAEAAAYEIDPGKTGSLDRLHDIIIKDLPELTEPPVSEYLANALISNAKELYLAKHQGATDFIRSDEQLNELINGIDTLLKGEAGGDLQSRRELANSLSRMFSNFDGARIDFLDLLLESNQQALVANLIMMAVTQPQDEELVNEGVYTDKADLGFRRHISPMAPVRWSAMHQADAALYGPTPIGNRMGTLGTGGKVNVNLNYLHPKDMGPNLLRFGGWNQKILVDSFGFGLNRFKTDSNDGMEGLYYVTGISLHKMPFLANTAEYLKRIHAPGILGHLDQKAWFPEAMLEATVDGYSYQAISNIYGRLGREKYYDQQAIARIAMEIGGFEYDSQGQPIADKKTFASKDDQYRMNNEMAEFIARGFGTHKEGEPPFVIPDHLKRIHKRLTTDKMIVNGNLVEVYEKDGQILTKVGDTFVQKGSLKIGQMSQNMLEEIKEIMVYKDQNTNLKEPRWKLGKDMEAYTKSLEDPQKKIARMHDFEKLAKAMMVEDARRRENNEGTYTFLDLMLEMEQVQEQKTEPLFDSKGRRSCLRDDHDNIIPDAKGNPQYLAEERYIDPKIRIGNSDPISLKVAKDMMKEFALSRSEKVVAVGVWGKEPKKMLGADGKASAPIDPQLWAQLTHVRVPNMDPNDPRSYVMNPNIKVHPVGDKQYQSIYEINGKFYLVHQTRQGETVYEVDGLKQEYSKDAKLSFYYRMTGVEFEMDPIKGMRFDLLKKLYGEAKVLHYLEKIKDDNVPIDIFGRETYTTAEGQMFDDVYDEIDKAEQGKKLSYQYSVKLYQIDKYRDYSKMKKEYYEGFLMLEDLFRKGVLVATVLGVLFPPLAMLACPELILGTLFWALAGQPFLSRAAKGWAARMNAAIQAQNNVAGMSADFFGLLNEQQPPSYGQIDLARTEYETVKFQFRSVLKSFNEGAKWNSNSITDIFSQAWGRVTK